MGARAFGISAENAVLQTPDIEDIELVTFGNGLAILTDGGVYLLDAGRWRRAPIDAARSMVQDLATLAFQLDNMQHEIAQRAEQQAKDIERAALAGTWLNNQRFCITLTAELNRIRMSLDQPLETKRAGLVTLSEAISRKWNIRSRLAELTNELEALQTNGRIAEETRAFDAGRLAAALAIALVAADALASRTKDLLLSLLGAGQTSFKLMASPWLEILLFAALMVATFVILSLATPFVRRKVLWRRNKTKSEP